MSGTASAEVAGDVTLVAGQAARYLRRLNEWTTILDKVVPIDASVADGLDIDDLVEDGEARTLTGRTETAARDSESTPPCPGERSARGGLDAGRTK